MQKRSAKHVILLALLFAAYFLTGKLALSLAFINPSASAIWPPAGLALAAMILAGYSVWPAVMAGAFLVNLTTTGVVATSLVIAVGNTAEALLGAYLVDRLVEGRNVFRSPQRIFRFTALIAIATTVSPSVGVLTLCLANLAGWSDFQPIWTTWWLGDLTGALLVTPLIVLWVKMPQLRWRPWHAVEAGALLGLLVVVSLVVFGGLFPSDIKNYPLEFLCVPFILWAAFRFGRREVVLVMAILSTIAAWGTLHGAGPFVRETENESLLLLQAYLGVMCVMSLALGAVIVAHQQAEARLRELATTDPLTGLANYRRLMEVLRVEIARSERTQRPFSVLFLDLNGLKGINDKYGHLAGSRALCRVADALRGTCRFVDTPARFGGDEFAIVLPETGEAGARTVASRLAQRLAADQAPPAISVSGGIAEFPRDGTTPALLLSAADRHLYDEKALGSGKKAAPRPPAGLAHSEPEGIRRNEPVGSQKRSGGV
jgi:diguanylate cyclase (GGDEF)-like protein